MVPSDIHPISGSGVFGTCSIARVSWQFASMRARFEVVYGWRKENSVESSAF